MKDHLASYTPVIIIGAGRSGTNMLRNMLIEVPGFGTWPCDEINYIWRHGNRSFPTDEFLPEMARPEVVKFIRNAFDKLATRQDLSYVVEKTCANSLRVGFVHRVFPDARFIHIVRDGRDVAASAVQRWKAPLDFPYLFRKAVYVPRSDLPYYAGQYLLNRLARFRSREQRLATWGPRFKGMQDVLADNPLPLACAIQWQQCVEAAESQLTRVPADQVLSVRYESFVKDPKPSFERIQRFLQSTAKEDVIAKATSVVRVGRSKSWRNTLDTGTGNTITQVLSETLARLGYEID